MYDDLLWNYENFKETGVKTADASILNWNQFLIHFPNVQVSKESNSSVFESCKNAKSAVIRFKTVIARTCWESLKHSRGWLEAGGRWHTDGRLKKVPSKIFLESTFYATCLEPEAIKSRLKRANHKTTITRECPKLNASV